MPASEGNSVGATRQVQQLPPGVSVPGELEGAPVVDTAEVMATVGRMQTAVSALMLKGADDATIRARLSTMFPRIKDTQPFLFEKACRPLTGEDLRILQMMLASVERMKANPSTRHNASVDVGQVLVNKYVRPLVE